MHAPGAAAAAGRSAFVGTGMESKVAIDQRRRHPGASHRHHRPGRRAADRDPGDRGSGAWRCRRRHLPPAQSSSARNQNSCINQRPLVKVGDKVTKGEVIADGPCTDMGEWPRPERRRRLHAVERLQLTRTSILISERIVRDDVFTSLHTREFEVAARGHKARARGDHPGHPHWGERRCAISTRRASSTSAPSVETGATSLWARSPPRAKAR